MTRKAVLGSDMRPIFIGISFLLILGSAASSAQPGGYRRDGMNAVRAYQMQGFAFERSGPQRDERQAEAEHERRRSREADSSGYGAQGDGRAESDQTRKHGKLSPEERRALRRQIDEAGQDLYTRKR